MNVTATYMVRYLGQWHPMIEAEGPDGSVYFIQRIHAFGDVMTGQQLLSYEESQKLIDDTTVYLAS